MYRGNRGPVQQKAFQTALQKELEANGNTGGLKFMRTENKKAYSLAFLVITIYNVLET